MNRKNPVKCRLIGVQSKKSLAEILKIDLKDLIEMSKDSKKYFREFTDHSKGKPRTCQEPNKQLKQIHRLLKIMLSFIELPDYVYSGRKKRCYVDNARVHVGNPRLTKMDIASFYPSCRREYVYRFFVDKLNMSFDTAEILTNITTYNGHIPTGSPVSQILAYLIHKDIFDKISLYAKKNGFTFTLYVDDLCFSGSSATVNSKISVFVNAELKRKSLKLKRSKLVSYGPQKDKLVTGCIVGKEGRLSAPDKLKKMIFDPIRVEKGNISRIDPKTLRSSFGRVQAVKQIEGKLVFGNLSSKILSEMRK